MPSKWLCEVLWRSDSDYCAFLSADHGQDDEEGEYDEGEEAGRGVWPRIILLEKLFSALNDNIYIDII